MDAIIPFRVIFMSPHLFLWLALATVGFLDSSIAMVVVESMTPTLRFPLLTEQDQEIIWEGLKYAAHETSDVRDVPLLKPYGQEFGKWTGDLGVGAVDVHNNQVVGVAWIRNFVSQQNNGGIGGFCTQGENLRNLLGSMHNGKVSHEWES